MYTREEFKTTYIGYNTSFDYQTDDLLEEYEEICAKVHEAVEPAVAKKMMISHRELMVRRLMGVAIEAFELDPETGKTRVPPVFLPEPVEEASDEQEQTS